MLDGHLTHMLHAVPDMNVDTTTCVRWTTAIMASTSSGHVRLNAIPVSMCCV